ncbi:MAG: hypothetical protein GX640_10075, partial [Fibrobacter sp.]|nr:hypothetical protein [Fibrobacter sp.]
NSFAIGTKIISADKISLLNAPAITIGSNTLTVTVTSHSTMKYGFIELIVTGSDQSGNPTSTIGFIPYRAESQGENILIPLAVSDGKMKGTHQMKSYEIYDLNGRKITKLQNTMNTAIALQQYHTATARGMYIIKTTDLLTGKVEYLRNLRIDDLLKK